VADASRATAPWWSRWSTRQTDAASGIYGTIVATAVIAGTARHEPHGPVLALTAGTLVVFWLAHVYAETLSDHLKGSTELRLATVTGAMARELPMLEGPLPSLALLLLGTLGLLDDGTAINLALWAGVAQLVGWGVVYARGQGRAWPAAVATGLVNGTFGVLIIALKAFVH
jgi:hypothetical protein